MKKRRLLNLFGILLGILMCFNFSKVEAAESIFSKVNLTRDTLKTVIDANTLNTAIDNTIVPITLKISESNYKTNNGKVYWSISDTNNTYKDIYCLNLSRGFGAPDGGSVSENNTKIYTTQYSSGDSNFASYTGLNDEQKNKILKILNNSITSTEDIKELLTKASTYVENAGWTSWIKKDMESNDLDDTKLTFDDIKIIQQIAIWHYTNPESVFENTINAICDSNGNQISSQGTNILVETDTYYNYLTSGFIKQKKINALYKYFINVAENSDNDYSSAVPELAISNENAVVAEDGNYYIAGPFELTGKNTEKIKSIIANVNKPYTLLDSSKETVENNNFSEVIGSNFYLKFSKNDITTDTQVTLNIQYKYDVKTLIFMTDKDDPNNTQPVVIVKTEEKTENINTNINILLTEVNVEKVWDDNEDQDGVRPTSIQVQLYADGEIYGNPITLNETNNWKHTWAGLLAGKAYSVVELDEDGNIIPVNGKYNDDYTNVEYSIEGTKTIITNKHIPEVTEKTVTKIWDDNENQDGIRPTSIQVQLYANGKEVGEPITISENNGEWSYTWSNLPKFENGEEIIYTVVEKQIDGYTTTYSEDTFTITNTYTPGKVAKTVIKSWDDESDIDQIRPDEITVTLYKIVDGQEIAIDTQVLNEDNNWRYTWDNLDEKQDGEIIIYLVKEQEIDGYETTYSAENYLDTNVITITNKHTPLEQEFDMSLRKFITSVNDNVIQREPIVDTSTISTTGTATYKHTKEPVSVQVGDIVTYTIRVYNEGEVDGYVSQITDYLPEWLDFLPNDELNQKYLWQQDINNNRKITTNITSKDSATGETIYSNRENKQLLSAYNGSDSLDYIDVEIRCQVNENAQLKQLITNIAEISGMQDKEGIEVTTDRDSTISNMNLPTDEDLPNYKGNESNKSDLTDKDYYYKGQEDDDDFEKLIVENFDLALRKFIVQVNDKTYSREPVVDTSLLGTTDENGNIITTAIYTHTKEPVPVQVGDKVTYTIRIYNEGTISGFANEVVDYIPNGLKFIEDSSINKTYGWTVDGNTIKTNYLSDSNINNSISGISEDSNGNKVLDYKDIQVQFEVVANPTEYIGEIIVNWAEVNEDSNNDIDSIPGNNKLDEDDIDYERVELVYFDLALRKFITNVDGTEYNNRIPEVDTSKIGTIDEVTGEKITTAEYTHTKDPVVLETGSTVIYTIRVYNEGTIDGYASEVTDDIPAGLEFLPENEINLQYKWTMIDKEGNITTDASQANKIITNYLSEENDSSNIISAYQESNGSVALDYKDIKVAFKVTEPNTSDRIIVNTAQISEDSNDDIDSIPGNDVLTEDDIDREYVKVETFDLALEKWVTATKVTYNGKTKTTKTGFTADSTEMAKVDLVASQLKKTTVKFVYSIRVINEGQVAGYATEIKDYVPSGLKFVKEDNPEWTLQEDGTVTTDQLKDTLLEPGQSATVEITLTWKNSSTNMGVKTNWAEISADSGDDIDSTPDNYNKSEDDIDDASVILSIKTGSVRMYITLAFISVMILGVGVFLIKKYVISK